MLQLLEALLRAAAHTAGHAVAAETRASRLGACSHSTWKTHNWLCTAGTCSTKQSHSNPLTQLTDRQGSPCKHEIGSDRPMQVSEPISCLHHACMGCTDCKHSEGM